MVEYWIHGCGEGIVVMVEVEDERSTVMWKGEPEGYSCT